MERTTKFKLPDDATTPDIDQAVAILTDTLWENPVTRWLFPMGCEDRRQWAERFFRFVVDATLANGGFVYLPEHADFVATGSIVDAGPREPFEVDDVTAQKLACATGLHFPRALQLLRALDESHPHDLPAHVYLSFLCVSEHARGQRLPMALRQWFAPQQLGLFAEASDERVLTLAKRIGFRQVGDAVRLPDDGPLFFPIFLDPDTSAR